MKYYSIDRVEGTKAVLIDDDGNSIEIETDLFDEAPKESDIVEEKDSFFVIDRAETERRRAMAVERLRMLLKRNEKPKTDED